MLLDLEGEGEAKRYYYSYDPAGNRTAEQIDDAVTSASYNNMNQLVSQQAGGALVFKGTVSEPANVSRRRSPPTTASRVRPWCREGRAKSPSPPLIHQETCARARTR